jgi:hypothetical protein
MRLEAEDAIPTTSREYSEVEQSGHQPDSVTMHEKNHRITMIRRRTAAAGEIPHSLRIPQSAATESSTDFDCLQHGF